MNFIQFLVIAVIIVVIIKSSREEAKQPPTPKKPKGKRLVCPQCESVNVDILDNSRKGFSVKKAAAGGVLTGGIGTLAGFAGGKNKKPTMRCKECGHVFKYKL